MTRHKFTLPLLMFIFIASGIIASLQSCDNKADGRQAPVDSIARKHADSLVYTNTRDIDRLVELVDSFSQAGDIYGVSLAARQLGGQYRNKSEYVLSHQALRTSLVCAEKLQDTLELMQTLNYIATTFRRQGTLDSATIYHYAALDLSNHYSKNDTYDGQKNRAVTINGLGNIYLMYKHYQMADSLFHISLECERNIGSLKGQALNYAQIGGIKADNNQPDSALAYYQKAIAMNRSEKNLQGIAISLNQIGTLLRNLGRYDEAIDTLEASYQLLQKLGDRMQWLRPCTALAGLYLRRGDLKRAQHYLDTATIVANQLESSKQLGRIHFLYAELYAQRGNYREAYLNMQEGCEYEDSLRALDNQQVTYMKEQQAREEFFTDQLEHKNQDMENVRAHNRIILLRIGVTAAVTLIIILVWILFNRQRHINLLEKEKQAAETARQEAIAAKQQTDKALEQAEAASRMKTLFLQNISHELRTPLNAIQGFTDILTEQDKDMDAEERLTCTNMIHKNTHDLVTLVSDMVDFAELESGSLHIEPAIFSLHEAIDNTLRNLAHLQHDGQEVHMGKDTTENTLVHTDQRLFIKVLENYLSNALKYTDNGSITIDLQQKDGTQSLIVTDTGIGIKPENAEKIFERFEKLNSFKQGNGLGLTIVRLVADVLHGKAYLDTTYTGGARFVFTFPMQEL